MVARAAGHVALFCRTWSSQLSSQSRESSRGLGLPDHVLTGLDATTPNSSDWSPCEHLLLIRPPHPGADEISVSRWARGSSVPMWHRISARLSEVAPNPSAVASHREATLLQTGPHSVDAMSGQRTSILLSSSPYCGYPPHLHKPRSSDPTNCSEF
jgi:hypothetical protein